MWTDMGFQARSYSVKPDLLAAIRLRFETIRVIAQLERDPNPMNKALPADTAHGPIDPGA
jgi:hypothetical protein